MKAKKILALTLATLTIGTAFAGCGTKNDSSSSDSSAADTTTAADSKADPASVKGDITVLTNRTDIVDTVLKDYSAKFKEKYPNVNVKWEAITNYEDDVKTRMSTTEYGDVLLIPGIAPSEFPTFFEPLGKVDDLKSTYRYVDSKGKFEDTVYGLTTFGAAQGVLYNTKVFKDAGITTSPKTSDEFIADMKKIKDKFGDDVIPYYTNYAAGWTLNQWQDQIISVSGDPDYINNMAHEDDPFAQGKAPYQVYKLMYDLVKAGVVEKDPMTSDWESSKQMLADGKIGAMVLGSWSIGQIQALAKDPADVGYMPFPSNKGGKMYATSGPDYQMGVNKNSKNKEAALAFLHWFIDESKFYDYCQSISPRIDDPLPASLKAFADMGVEFVVGNPAKAGEDGLVDKVAKQAELGQYDDPWKKPIVEKALSGESFDDYMKELNGKWKQARADVGAN